jgi:HTH-type transcriptional regulator / antitoxin HigA
MRHRDERARFPIDIPDPIDAIRFRLEQQGADAKALVGVIGSRTRVYEVLRRDLFDDRDD